MNKYKIQVSMYITAANETIAAGVAELHTHMATECIRKANSGWVQDTTTLLTTEGGLLEIKEIPNNAESYKKEPLIQAFGEDTAIRFLNNQINKAHQ